MYCPSCGIKNETAAMRCFICKETMPSGRPPERVSASRSPRPASGSASADVYGSPGDRFIALVLDRMLLAAILLIPAAALAENWKRLAIGPLLVGLSGAAALVLVFLYHVSFESIIGTTPGKAILGLYVRNEGERGTLASMAIRNLVRIVDSLALYAVGFLAALFSPRKRRLGDIAASTVVLERKIGAPARAALIVMWIAIIVASAWLASVICPECSRLPYAK